MAAVLLGWGRIAAAQTADDVIEKYLTAIGGREALGKLTSRSAVGTITLVTPAGKISGPIAILNQRPNKSRTLINVALSAFGAGPLTPRPRIYGTSAECPDTLPCQRHLTRNPLHHTK